MKNTFPFWLLVKLTMMMSLSESTETESDICGMNEHFCIALIEAGACTKNRSLMDEHCVSFCEKCKDVSEVRSRERSSGSVKKHDYDCKDNPDNKNPPPPCSILAEQGFCENSEPVIRGLCPDTCGFCVYDGLCLDRNPKCTELTNSGMCHKNSTYMVEHCPVSCGNCDALCLDLSKQCAQIAAKGECEKNSAYRNEVCPLSCGMCGQDGFCLDKNKNCSELAEKGKCQSNSTYMTEFCPLSCGKCAEDGFCLDKSKKCHALAKNGDCAKNTNHIAEFCPISCGRCGDDGLCLDRNKNCPKMAADGDCKKNTNYMTENCPTSCNKCGSWNINGSCNSYHFLDVQKIINVNHAFQTDFPTEGRFSYACRKTTSKGYQLGEALRRYTENVWTWGCWTTWAGKMTHTVSSGFEILIDPERDNLEWIQSDGKSFPLGAIVGGVSPSGESLIVSRCTTENQSPQLQVAGYVKLNAPGKSYFGFGSTEHSCDDYEILTCTERRPDEFCLDRNKLCPVYAKEGRCTNNATIMQFCPFSCGKCDNLCLDMIKNCSRLAESGNCETNSTFMSRFCPLSCGLCETNGFCLDKTKQCFELAGKKECDPDSGNLIQMCPLSCGKCGHDGFCLDRYKNCSELAKKGGCITNFTHMVELCPSVCGKCGKDGFCLDKNTQCVKLALEGECQKNSTFMMDTCPASCHKCDEFCLDRSKKCPGQAKKGECRSNASYMTDVCVESCHKCGDTGICLDKRTNCAKLAADWECETNPAFMEKNCPASCKKCGGFGVRGDKCKSYLFVDIKELNNTNRPFPTAADNFLTKYTSHFICRATHANGLYLGAAKNFGGSWKCLITWNGVITEIEGPAQILTDPDGDDLKWVRSNRMSIPAGAIFGGISSSGEPLVISRCSAATAEGQTDIPGYVRQNFPDIAYFGHVKKEYSCKQFDVLTCWDPFQGFCLDKNKKCDTDVSTAECKTNAGHMTVSCPVSCGKCGNERCLDRTKNCAELAENGDCDLNAKYMDENCPASCKKCTKDCDDLHYDCELWVQEGRCKTDKVVMRANCAKSCEFCRVFSKPLMPFTEFTR